MNFFSRFDSNYLILSIELYLVRCIFSLTNIDKLVKLGYFNFNFKKINKIRFGFEFEVNL